MRRHAAPQAQLGPTLQSTPTHTHYTFVFSRYVTAAQHFDKINSKNFVVPSIIITAFASFVSFVSSHSLIPGTIRTLLALFVGFLGTYTCTLR